MVASRCLYNAVSISVHSQRRWANALVQKSVVSVQKLVRVIVLYFLHRLIGHKGMYALRERRQHVTQEDFEFAVAKVSLLLFHLLFPTYRALFRATGAQEEPRREYFCQQAVLLDVFHACFYTTLIIKFTVYSRFGVLNNGADHTQQ
jgi:hypothetical protein